MHEHHDVAIVGYGPVGATLANLLALRGLRVLVIERDADIYRLPRAISLDAECMRVMQTIGVADTLLPTMRVGTGMRFVNADGQLLVDWSRPPEIGHQGWHPSYLYHQPVLEATLRARLADQASVKVLLRHEVCAIDSQPDRVTLSLRNLEHGGLLEASADWVIGCDGARSCVRRVMGIELDDLGSHERWLVVDVILKRDRPDLGDRSIQFCDPARPSTYVCGVGRRRRWELMLLPGEDAETLCRPEQIWSLLRRWVTPDDAELERPACYTFHSVVAQGWRRGRLLIAGDAAHQTPPFMGQGLCAGIRDASNLAWKLADVIDGTASEDLLDSYESERSPHVREFIETTLGLGRIIQETDPQAARRRDALLLEKPLTLTAPRPRLGTGDHDGGEFSGRTAEQPRLADGSLLDDGIGYRHALLIDPVLAAQVRLPCDGSLAVLPSVDAACSEWLARLNTRAILIRPDRYIAGVAANATELAALLSRHHRTRTR